MYTQIDSDMKEKDVATGVSGRSVRSTATQDNDLDVAEKYQFQKYVEKYIVWTPEYNFMMNGLGEVIDPETGEADSSIDIESPLAEEGIMPFFEVAKEKDFEFFVRAANGLTDFTIQFNTRLSDESNVIKLNGYAVGVLKAPSELQPEHQVIGAAMLLKLPTDNGKEMDVDFSFASPSSNIGEISEANDRFLNYFVTTEGLGNETINSNGQGEKFNSGLDRFIAMLDRVEAHSDDYQAFRCAEDDIYEIIKAWLRVLNGSDQLDRKYQIPGLSEDSEVIVDYHKPELVQTETEKVANIEKKLDRGLMSRSEAIADLRGIELDKAKEVVAEIDEEEMNNMPMGPMFVPPSQNEDMDLDQGDDEDDDE
jgi:hypothetical protein